MERITCDGDLVNFKEKVSISVTVLRANIKFQDSGGIYESCNVVWPVFDRSTLVLDYVWGQSAWLYCCVSSRSHFLF